MPMPIQGSEGGPGIVALAYVMSCVGCALGLSAMSRARATGGGVQAGWLALSALSIGGTGIWVMHFIAMLGFTLPAIQITYDVPITLTSLLVAVVVVGVGLTIVVAAKARVRALVLGGVVTGLGVASMHYLGMAAICMPANVSYRPLVVLASVIIAVTAATAALWAAMNIRGTAAMIGASLVMGLAVSGMHYTGMAAMVIHSAPSPTDQGLSAGQLLMPLVVGIALPTIVMLYIVGLASTEKDLLQQDEIRANLRKLRSWRENPD